MKESGLLLIAAAAVLGCSKADKSGSEAPTASGTTTAASTPSSSSGGQSGSPRIRGAVTSISDSVLTVSSRGGVTRVVIVPPLEVYSRVPATLSQVKASSFVGITSVEQADGSQRATEIHIFPEKLRGTGEGSRLMGPGGSNGAAPGRKANTMTNGTVAGSSTPEKAGGAPRMTNGTISGAPGGTLTVQYQGGTQTITVPPDVSVTAIALTQTKLTPGDTVTVLATKQPDGTLTASTVMLGGPRGQPRRK